MTWALLMLSARRGCASVVRLLLTSGNDLLRKPVLVLSYRPHYRSSPAQQQCGSAAAQLQHPTDRPNPTSSNPQKNHSQSQSQKTKVATIRLGLVGYQPSAGTRGDTTWIGGVPAVAPQKDASASRKKTGAHHAKQTTMAAVARRRDEPQRHDAGTTCRQPPLLGSRRAR